MKLLLDENISFRVAKSIETNFPGSTHISLINDGLKEDLQIFKYAAVNNFAIVTFDEDFYDLQLLRGYPPKIIWLRFGNSNNLKVTTKLVEHRQAIESFLSNPEVGILEIY
ncbi:hypothetical protein WSM22_06680 [Cytophagales bacterium WSM2-2]|nr:hypothetical protein WSM22_06680 [Cytophagales bacterium WSM2-2]